MEELIAYYRKMIALLEEEYLSIAVSLQGEFLDSYRLLIQREKEELERNLQKIMQFQ